MSSTSVLDGPEPAPPAPDPDVLAAEIAGHLNVQHARLVEMMADVLTTDSWVGTGVHTPTQWLAWKTGLSPERAAVIAKVAAKRSEFPCVFELFERGVVSLEQVAVVVDRAPAWADSKVISLIDGLNVSQLRLTINDHYFDDGPEPEPAVTPKPNRVSFGVTDDRWRITGNLDPATGRLVEAALIEAKDSLFEQGDHDATWADALVEVAETSLDAVPSDSRRDRFRTWLHLDVTNGSTTTTDGWRIPTATRDRILCDGIVQPVWETDGRPFSVGRSQRIVPDRTRRIIERRDRGCRVPGCTATRFVEIHQIIHWLQGGATDTWNLISLCGKHHRQHHHSELGITGNADEPSRMVFTDTNGNLITNRGSPTLPKDDPPEPTPGFTPPSGGRMNDAYFPG